MPVRAVSGHTGNANERIGDLGSRKDFQRFIVQDHAVRHGIVLGLAGQLHEHFRATTGQALRPQYAIVQHTAHDDRDGMYAVFAGHGLEQHVDGRREAIALPVIGNRHSVITRKIALLPARADINPSGKQIRVMRQQLDR